MPALILRTPRRGYYLVRARGRYERVAPGDLAARLRGLGLEWCTRSIGSDLNPSEIADKCGDRVTRSVFDAAERGEL